MNLRIARKIVKYEDDWSQHGRTYSTQQYVRALVRIRRHDHNVLKREHRAFQAFRQGVDNGSINMGISGVTSPEATQAAITALRRCGGIGAIMCNFINNSAKARITFDTECADFSPIQQAFKAKQAAAPVHGEDGAKCKAAITV